MIGDNRSRLTRRIVDIGARLVVLQQTCGASATMFHAKSVIGGFGLTTEIAGYSDERVYSNTQTIVTIVFAIQVSGFEKKKIIYLRIAGRKLVRVRIRGDKNVKLLQKTLT